MILQALNAQEESQRMIAIRKAYQRAVVTPTHHVEQLWRDYENFENSVSRQLVSLCSGLYLLSLYVCVKVGTYAWHFEDYVSSQLVIFGTGFSVCVCGWVFVYIYD